MYANSVSEPIWAAAFLYLAMAYTHTFFSIIRVYNNIINIITMQLTPALSSGFWSLYQVLFNQYC